LRSSARVPPAFSYSELFFLFRVGLDHALPDRMVWLPRKV
jgi:hypothetical protein